MPEPEFAIEFDGQALEGWSSVEYREAVDEVASFTIEAPFDPNDADQRERFRPFRFQFVKPTLGGEPLTTGLAVNISPTGSAEVTRVSISGYAGAGIWEDCMPPGDMRPLEFNGLKLDKIAKALGEPFGLAPVFDADLGAKFDKVAIEADQPILGFLQGLAQQRGLVISSDADGQPLFHKTPETGVPLFEATAEDIRPIVTLEQSSNGQALFSEYTGIAATKTGRRGSSHTERPAQWAGEVRRTKTETLQDTEPADVPEAVRASVGRAYAEAASYAVTIPTLVDQLGQRYKPGAFVSIAYPRMMIYTPTLFLIRAVVYTITPESKTTTLELTLPGVFSGTLPVSLPWEG
jgi:prophage tail gpP-like protein